MSLLSNIKDWSQRYYRFVIMDNTTFEEKIVFKLMPLSIFASLITAIFVLIILSISLVAFTPLREYIPCYGSTKQAQKIVALQNKIDSLDIVLTGIEHYERGIKMILLGKNFGEDTLTVANLEKREAKFTLTVHDSLLLQIKEEPAVKKEK
jgi:hypothetical protein